jgi:type II secretory pathway predicted ATPase ExeA
VSERDDLRFQLLLLTRLFEDEPGRDLKPRCLILIDQVATYASQQHRGLPQSIAEILAGAMHAAMRADVAGVSKRR